MQDKNNPQGLRVHKHIFVGNSRLVTAMTHTDNNGDNAEQREKRYYYHSDHLGSAQFVTDWRGKQYEHIEYTPYGELWIEEVAAGLDKLPFRFTGKEMDEETGLYYYGARYLDPKYSRWLSGDPALNDYIPKAPIDDDAKKHNENLPCMGGIYNTVNLHLYHYAGNNPIKYGDPDGKAAKEFVIAVIQTDLSIPDPSDLSLLKWGGYVAAIGLTATVEYFAIKAIQSSISKAKEANGQRNRELGSITIQIQQGTRSIHVGSTRFALNEKGVTKRQAQKALDEQVTMLSNNRGYRHLAKSKKFQTAVSEMSENIKTKHTVGDGDQRHMRVSFEYNGKTYRIDIRNNGNNPNLLLY